MLINIHTHSRTNKENQLEIVVGEDTVGIHPWDLNKKNDFSKAREFCLMVGETGLDRSDRYKDTLPLQTKFLHTHLEAAKTFHLPIVIHCVRAHSDLLWILKESKYPGKILLHDFLGNNEQIEAYLKFDVYFSFRKNFEVLKYAPLDRVFLETDDQKQFSIEDIYKKVGIVELQFEKNYLVFFSDANNVRSADVIDDLRLALKSN